MIGGFRGGSSYSSGVPDKAPCCGRDPTRWGQRWPARMGRDWMMEAKSIMEEQDGPGVALAIHLCHIFPGTVVANEAQIYSKPMFSPLAHWLLHHVAFASRIGL